LFAKQMGVTAPQVQILCLPPLNKGEI